MERLEQRYEDALGVLIRSSESVAQGVEDLDKRGGRAAQEIPDQGRLCGEDRQRVIGRTQHESGAHGADPHARRRFDFIDELPRVSDSTSPGAWRVAGGMDGGRPPASV
jgi:hypothetical protein